MRAATRERVVLPALRDRVAVATVLAKALDSVPSESARREAAAQAWWDSLRPSQRRTVMLALRPHLQEVR